MVPGLLSANLLLLAIKDQLVAALTGQLWMVDFTLNVVR
ncbi:hypothetical protein AC26_4270 [Escherichia coli 1-176-05_S3_C2]|nr:hypothetical protein AC26_4270 [Escherichia coli 1-176-05_S3_C2]